MALILIIIIFIVYENVFAYKCYLYGYGSNATSTYSFSASMFRVYKCACVIKFHVARLMNILMKMASNSVETLFYHSIWRYHLNICRPEFYYECDWNGARIIVIVQKQKNDLFGK